MRSFAAVTVAGVAGIILLKLLATLLFPLLGILIGLLMTTVKFALIAAVIFFVYSLMRRRKREREA